MKVILTGLILSLSLVSNAKVFRNAYISFEMPDTWSCKLEQTEWVCRSEQSKESREAIIILTAKEAGPTDSIALYEAHLDKAIQAQYKGGQSGFSKKIYKPKTVSITDQQWVDGLHLGSEVRNYYTRYLATIKDKIAILVTFSAHHQHYAKYANDFFNTIKSLKVIATKDLLAKPDSSQFRNSADTFGSGISGAFPTDMQSADSHDESSDNSQQKIFLGLAILLATAGVFYFIKKKRS